MGKLDKYFITSRSPRLDLNVQIMIVDDDTTTLSVVSSLLKRCTREASMPAMGIVAMKSPVEALEKLRLHHESFDLVLTDLHMPEMNGDELQRLIEAEFKLPVIIMSTDDKQNVMLESLNGGALRYILKPIRLNDIKYAWQYAVAAKKGKTAVVIEEIRSIRGAADLVTSSVEKLTYQDDTTSSASSVNEEKRRTRRNDHKKKHRKRGREDGDEDAAAVVARKRAKVTWTNSLHNRFLQAINHLGLDKAVPKKILECMGVPGLTRENVASHLQKYRLFLKRVAEKGSSSLMALSERAMRSTFALGHNGMTFPGMQPEYPQFPGQQSVMANAMHPGTGMAFGASSNYGPPYFHYQDASRNNSAVLPPCPYGQPHLSGNPTGFQQPTFGNTNPLYPASQQPNYPGTNMWSYGGMPYGSFNFGATGSTGAPGTGNMGANINPAAYSHLNLNANSNYAGLRMTGDVQFMGLGPTQLNGCSALTYNNSSFNAAGYGFMGGAINYNANAAASPRNGTFGYFAPGSPYSAGFGTGNQVPMDLGTGFNHGNNPGFASLPQQQYGFRSTGEGENCYNFNLMDNNDPEWNGIANQLQQLGIDERAAEHGAASGFLNVNNSGLFTSEHLPDSYNAPANFPWTIQLPSQVEGRDVLLNDNNGDNPIPANEYHPIFAEQQGLAGEPLDSELSGFFPVDNAPSAKQGWGDEDFLDSMLNDDDLL